MKKNILILVGLLISVMAFCQEQNVPPRQQRVPAYPYPISKVQPDNGDTVMIRLIGDERWHCTITLDGWIITENNKGVLCYAKEVGERQYKATRRRAHDEGKRSKCEERWLKKHGLKYQNH